MAARHRSDGQQDFPFDHNDSLPPASASPEAAPPSGESTPSDHSVLTEPPAPRRAPGGETRFVRLDQLRDGPLRLRRAVAPGSIEELAGDLEATGHVEPLTVRRRPSQAADGSSTGDDTLETVLGHRRADALRLLQERASARGGDAAATPRWVPVVVVETDDVQALSLVLVESQSHQRLAPWDHAQGVAKLAAALEAAGQRATQRALADRVRVSPATINGAMAIADGVPAAVLVAAGYRTADGAFDPSQVAGLTREALIEAAAIEDVSQRVAFLAMRRQGSDCDVTAGFGDPAPPISEIGDAVDADSASVPSPSVDGESHAAPALAAGKPSGRAPSRASRARAELPSDANELYAALKGGARWAERPRRPIPALTPAQAAIHLARVATAAAVLSERANDNLPVVELDPGGGGVVVVIAGDAARSAEGAAAIAAALQRLSDRVRDAARPQDA